MNCPHYPIHKPNSWFIFIVLIRFFLLIFFRRGEASRPQTEPERERETESREEKTEKRKKRKGKREKRKKRKDKKIEKRKKRKEQPEPEAL